DRKQIKNFILSNLARVLNEYAGYSRVLESARLLGDASAEFAERSKLYATRGLSADTSILPNFAIDRTLASLKSKQLLQPGSVRRVGVIGPGLDFTDKQDGYDFYPQQTIQPFAVIDSLIRLGLADPARLRVTTFDLNPRVNDHLNRAAAAATRGEGYVIQLPRDPAARWHPDLVNYWWTFGDKIAAEAPAVRLPPGVADVTIRAVKVKPAVVRLVDTEDTNIVLQRPEPAPEDQFDLLIATN